jgi:hypothetical protein
MLKDWGDGKGVRTTATGWSSGEIALFFDDIGLQTLAAKGPQKGRKRAAKGPQGHLACSARVAGVVLRAVAEEIPTNVPPSEYHEKYHTAAGRCRDGGTHLPDARRWSPGRTRR